MNNVIGPYGSCCCFQTRTINYNCAPTPVTLKSNIKILSLPNADYFNVNNDHSTRITFLSSRSRDKIRCTNITLRQY